MAKLSARGRKQWFAISYIRTSLEIKAKISIAFMSDGCILRKVQIMQDNGRYDAGGWKLAARKQFTTREEAKAKYERTLERINDKHLGEIEK